jgi:hypothetical protein
MTEEVKKQVPPRVLIAVINNERYMPSYFFNSMINLLNFTRRYFQVDIVNVSSYDVALMRNIASDIAIKAEYDFVFMCDLDMDYPADCILRLFKRFTEFNNGLNIIVGSARKRSPPFEYTQFYKTDITDFNESSNRVVPDRMSNELVKIEGSGLVGALIPIPLFELIPKPFFETIYQSDGRYTGEDINFAKKCKANGISLWLDPQVTYGHELIKMIDADGERMASQ